MSVLLRVAKASWTAPAKDLMDAGRTMLDMQHDDEQTSKAGLVMELQIMLQVGSDQSTCSVVGAAPPLA